ncbi:YrrS family protein [Bacillus sp. EAC]|uniref:YrrS family protein n=1 Tax=Bacillus sp. EAC TaxID=1978338 RepID=UPI000B430530|nr:YrrS family protein [Bacillus sp. EAC]
MTSIESNRRVRKFRKERRGNYFFTIFFIPLFIGIIYLGVKIVTPYINDQKIKPKLAKAEQTTPVVKAEPIAVEEPNKYQTSYREKVNKIIKDSNNDDNIIQSTVNEWKPTITSQNGSHTVQYSFHSQDFYEMEEAVSNAILLTKEDFSVWHLSKGYDEQSVKVFVATTDLSYKYIVYLHWVNQKGWLPILVQEVKELKY